MNEEILKKATLLANADPSYTDVATELFFASFNYDLARTETITDALPPEIGPIVREKVMSHIDQSIQKYSTIFYKYYIFSILAIMAISFLLSLVLSMTATLTLLVFMALFNIPFILFHFYNIPTPLYNRENEKTT